AEAGARAAPARRLRAGCAGQPRVDDAARALPLPRAAVPEVEPGACRAFVEGVGDPARAPVQTALARPGRPSAPRRCARAVAAAPVARRVLRRPRPPRAPRPPLGLPRGARRA